MLTRLKNYLWGGLQPVDRLKFGLLSLIFFCIIGSYWLLRTQKDAVFSSIVGLEYQPQAKILSLLLIIPILLIYTKLVDMWSKNRLLMTFSVGFALSFVFVAIFLQHPTIGLPNTVASSDRIFGWFVYVFIETFGSIMPGLFWAFVNSSVSTDIAKKGYPLIIAGAQLGSILGSYMSWESEYFGNAMLFNVGGASILAIVPAVMAYLWMVPANQQVSLDGGKEGSSKGKTGMFEGLKILLTRPYVLGIFALATLYEVVATILDFQMKVLAKGIFPTTEQFASFNGLYGVMTNALALLFAVVGTRYFIEHYGLRFCLILFPVLTGAVVSFVYMYRVFFVVTAAVMIIKALSYALNNPAKEMMYLPTSKDVKFKAKGWIDMFGSRSSKAAGSGVNWFLQIFTNDIMLYGTLMSLGVVGVWFLAATYVGNTFNRLTKNKEIVD